MKKMIGGILLSSLYMASFATPAMALDMGDSGTFYQKGFISDVTEEAQQKTLKELEERKNMLELSIRNSEFVSLSLREKITLLENYFTIRADIYKEKQKQVLSFNDEWGLRDIQQSLIQESDHENQESQLLSLLFKEIQSKNVSTLTSDDIHSLKDGMIQLVFAYQDFRNAGRDLYILTQAQLKDVYSNQVTLLNKFSQQYDLIGDKQQALELNKKLLKLTGGDAEIYQKLSHLLATEEKPFFFVDDELVEGSSPLLEQSQKTYMDIMDISKVRGFDVSSNKDVFIIQNGGHQLVIQKKDHVAKWDGTIISPQFVLVKNGKWYIPMEALFEMFRYQVEWNPDIQHWVIHKEVYPKNEIDTLHPEEIVSYLLPS